MKRQEYNNVESRSLWNYTLSRGWTEDEVAILKLALMKFGIGKWKLIIEFENICDLDQIVYKGKALAKYICKHKGWSVNNPLENVIRKNNCIINMGDNPTKEERKRRIDKNRILYGLTPSEIKSIKLPKNKNPIFANLYTLEEIETDKLTNVEKLVHLERLQKAIVKKIEKLKRQKKCKEIIYLDVQCVKGKWSIIEN